jgi:recombination DNA repair RAD52 pathway protein
MSNSLIYIQRGNYIYNILFTNKVNNLKKQAKKKFYANINENLDELKLANGKLYWKTMNMLIKNVFVSLFSKWNQTKLCRHFL